jgi:hypothetical protein
LPFTLTVTLTFCPGFKPVIVAFAEFGFVGVLGFGAMTALVGTFAAAATAAVATFADKAASAAALVATADLATDSVLTATASVA